MKDLIMKRFNEAKLVYEKMGVNVDEAIKKLSDIKISIHCWQGDDVKGFEESTNELSGGISATGNYIGKARNGEELRDDLDMALSLIPGKHKINLHALYAETDGAIISRDQLEPKHFKKWVDWAKKQGVGLDYNPSIFSHPMASTGLTLSNPNKEIREFWIRHCISSRKIGEYFGKELGQTCLTNIWIPDGFKDTPSDRLTPRKRLKESLDEIFSVKIDEKYNVDSLESKVFGIGVESYTVGSHEFYMNYCIKNNKLCLLDNGHFHPTESVADKISSILLFQDKIALHITRSVRWDSDHVVTYNDEIREIAKELVRNNALNKAFIGLDFFDASINRIAAWVLGARSFQKALLESLLIPNEKLKMIQDEGDYTTRLVLMEELKMYPLSDIWDYFCMMNNVPQKEEWLTDIKSYEKNILVKRGN